MRNIFNLEKLLNSKIKIFNKLFILYKCKQKYYLNIYSKYQNNFFKKPFIE